jgi:hypothetical protein
VLGQYWEPAVKAIGYFYVSDNELRNLEEPGWMFEHLQHVLNSNYKYLLDFVCLRGLRAEVTAAVSRHFLTASYASLFQPLIERRLAEDLPALNDFLLFNFLDEVGKL